MNKFKRSLILIFTALIGVAPAFSVTPDEMEKARIIAAQAYLRYVNNGSGYLDEVHPSSMADLESHLKEKEKENLKKFKSVGNPKDYSSWTKQQLSDYWSKTFLSAPGLDPAGKAAGRRISSRINAMTVSEPQAQTQEKPAQTEESVVAQTSEESQQLNEQPESDKPVVEPQSTQPEPVLSTEEVTADKEEINDEESKDENTASSEEPSSSTPIYILLLVVLVIAVIWVVVYAVNLSKKQNMEKEVRRTGRRRRDYDEEEDYEEIPERQRRRNYKPEYEDAGEIDNMRRSFAATLAEKDRRISALQEKYEELQTNNAENLAHISRLRREVAELKIMRDEARVDRAAEATPAPEERRHTQSRPAHTIYLGKVQANGVFVRADRDIVPGQTIFKLVTTDGVSGSFTVVENQKSQDAALDMPENFLINGCNGSDLFDTDGKSEIITDTAGTAIFENGVWKVIRKANISYK